MPDIDAAFHFITRTLETSPEGEPQFLMELLLFPELSSLGSKERKTRQALLDLVDEILAQRPLDEISRRLVAGKPELLKMALLVEPARRSEAWSEGVTMGMEAVAWRQGAHALACVPALGIYVVAPDAERLPGMLKEHALAALKRGGYNRSLLKLATLERGKLEMQSLVGSPKLSTAAELWKKAAQGDPGPDALTMLCSRMESPFLPRAFQVESDLKMLSRLLVLEDRPSVLLLGPSGAGKTALVNEMARRRNDFGLAKRPFYRSSGSRLVAGASGFGMWQQRCQELVKAAAEQKLVLYLGNLFELMNVGQSSAGNESIASFLRPYLVRRDCQVIVECTPEQMAVVEKQDARLADVFRLLRVQEPEPERADAILLAGSLELGRDAARFSRPALHRVTELHRRYMSYAAFPGAPLRFMKRVHESVPADRLIEEADVYASFSKETGMPQSLLDPAQRLDLDSTRGWFEQRVRGQHGAVAAIMAVIAQIKAGLSRPGRPLASLLFTGPTGTGKTEMAKALAQFLFQSSERMIRLDMSEYGQPWSAQRLVSGSQDGREGLLTARIREQPFSVLLLDEFEKADPAVFDLLLQVLGEARLTDAAGRTADFSNCVVIMTSNLGAQEFSKGRLGFNGSGGGALHDASEHFTTAVKKVLRPEMFNRIDRIVPYQPLTNDVVLELTRREIEHAAVRPGFVSAGLQLAVDDALVSHLAREGYDPRYGARPLKRRVAAMLLAPVAELMTQGLAEKSLIQARLDKDNQVMLTVVKPETTVADKEAIQNLRERLRQNAVLRQAYESLRTSPVVSGLQGRLKITMLRMKAAQRRAGKGVILPPDPKMPDMKKGLDRLEREASRQFAHEETLMLGLYRRDPSVLHGKDPLTRSMLEDTALELLTLWNPPPAALVLLIRGYPGNAVMHLAAVYRDLAEKAGGTVTAGLFYKNHPAKLISSDRQLAFAHVPDSAAEQEKLWEEPTNKLAAVALWIEGGRSTLFLKNESGLHLARHGRDKDKEKEKEQDVTKMEERDWTCLLEVSVPESGITRLTDFSIPAAECTNPPMLNKGLQRRVYDPLKQTVREPADNTRMPGTLSDGWLMRRLQELALKEVLP